MVPADFSQQYAAAQLAKRATEFCDVHDCSLFLGTWNVNNKMPGESLMSWLFPTSDVCDIYAIGCERLPSVL